MIKSLTIDGVDFSGEIGVKGILNLVDEFRKSCWCLQNYN